MDPKKQAQLEELCQKHGLDFNSLPSDFLKEIGRNYSPLTEALEIKNHDLRTLVEHHGIDAGQNPEFFRKVDETLNQYEKTLKQQGKAFTRKLQKTKYDYLTGCYIRKELGGLLHPHIELSRAKNHSLSVMMLDIDHFKDYNDVYGHMQGDLTLETIGQILRSIIKSPNSVVRYGGEEFYIILPETNAQDAQATAERIRSTIENTTFRKHPQLEEIGVDDDQYKSVTATIGVFTYHPGLDSVLGFYEADQKESKERGYFMVGKLINLPDQTLKNAKNRDQRNEVHITQTD